MFMHGVKRLLSMQTSSGGFSFWPGNDTPTYWGTAYVTHILLEGKQAGYPIAQQRIDDAVRFIETTLTNSPNKTDPKYGYSVAESEPYMQFVLAKAGRGRKGRVRQRIKRPGKLSEENLYLLKAALYLAGDRSFEADLRQPYKDGTGISDVRRNGWSFYSELRFRGMQLNIMEELFPQSAEAHPLATAIAERLRASKRSHSLTTQEISWTASGLGQRSRGGGVTNSALQLVMDGKQLKPQVSKSEAKNAQRGVTWQVPAASAAKSLTLKAPGLKGSMFAVVTVDGINPKIPYSVGDHSLRVQRQYRGAEGTALDLSGVALGDLVHVELTLTNVRNERMQNVALVDRFAAGLEIENPRLGRGHSVSWVDHDKLWDTDYMNIRDDRVEFFGHLQPNQSVRVVYTLRAVTAGEFESPPVQAEAMYEPRYWSRRLGRPVVITGPWDAS